MSLICAMSKEVPQEPVICTSSGLVYERRLLEKYIEAHGKEPNTNEEVTMDQIVEVKTKDVVKPRPPTATSLPSLIKLLQDEYDAAMFETFTLRKQLETTRQELSHSLYQHDAACRIIARLIKERDEARESLANMSTNLTAALPESDSKQIDTTTTTTTDVEETGGALPQEATAKITTMHEILQSQRKGKKKPQGLAPKDALSEYTELSNFHTLHSSSSPGVLCVSAHESQPNHILTGGQDKKAVLFDIEQDKVVTNFRGHTKKVTAVCYHASQEMVITGSADSTINLYSSANGDDIVHTFDQHKAEISSISLHPTEEFIVTSSTDASWQLHDIAMNKTLLTAQDPDNSPINCAEIHPDGILYGTGSSSKILRIWDIRKGEEAVALEGHSGAMSSITFSGNGYIIASTGNDNTVKLWDLRKMVNFKTVDLDPAFKVQKVKFDDSGAYFAIAGAHDIKLYNTKPLTELTTLQGHKKPVTDVFFMPLAKSVVSASKDRSVRVWGQAQ